jgi:hypothetical protein
MFTQRDYKKAPPGISVWLALHAFSAASQESADQDDCCTTNMQMLCSLLPGIREVCAPCAARDGECDAAFVGLER